MEKAELKGLAIKELSYALEHLSDARNYMRMCGADVPENIIETMSNAWDNLCMYKIILQLGQNKKEE